MAAAIEPFNSSHLVFMNYHPDMTFKHQNF